ncbi:unnamed protein product [Camellia sinensis]
MSGWIKEWCESIKEWKKGMVIEQERCVWLCCCGVPLNLWNNKTFSSIGRVWGEIIEVDNETLSMNSLQCGRIRIATTYMESINTTVNLNCQGTLYPMKVCEEQIITKVVIRKVCKCHKKHDDEDVCSSYEPEDKQKSEQMNNWGEDEDDEVDIQQDDELDNMNDMAVGDKRREHEKKADMESRDKVLNVSLVEKTVSNLGKSNSGGARAGVMMRVAQEEKQVEQGDNRIVDGEVMTSGFMKSLSGSIQSILGLNLEVVLNMAHEQNCDMGHGSGVVAQPNYSDSNQVISNILNQAQTVEKQQSNKKETRGDASRSYQVRKASRKEKAKRVSGHYFNQKDKLQIGKNRKELPMNLKKGAVFRAAVAAISLFMSS